MSTSKPTRYHGSIPPLTRTSGELASQSDVSTCPPYQAPLIPEDSTCVAPSTSLPTRRCFSPPVSGPSRPALPLATFRTPGLRKLSRRSSSPRTANKSEHDPSSREFARDSVCQCYAVTPVPWVAQAQRYLATPVSGLLRRNTLQTTQRNRSCLRRGISGTRNGSEGASRSRRQRLVSGARLFMFSRVGQSVAVHQAASTGEMH